MRKVILKPDIKKLKKLKKLGFIFTPEDYQSKTIEIVYKKPIINTLSGRCATRERVRKRDNYTCQKCGRLWLWGERRFPVHHLDCDKEKTLKYENYEKEQHNMVTLCTKCHLNVPEHRAKQLAAIRKVYPQNKKLANIK